jgi:hypothetical protein
MNRPPLATSKKGGVRFQEAFVSRVPIPFSGTKLYAGPHASGYSILTGNNIARQVCSKLHKPGGKQDKLSIRLSPRACACLAPLFSYDML